MEKINRSYYSIIPASIRYDDAITPNAKLLYGEITALCNEKGYCWAGNEYFANLYQKRKDTISKWISELEHNGYIARQIIYKEGSKEIKERRIYISPPWEKSQYPLGENPNTPWEKSQYPIGKNPKENNKGFNNKGLISSSGFKDVSEHYHNNIGLLAPIVAEKLNDWLEEMPVEVIKCAIDESVLNNTRSFKYVEGILNNWLKAGVNTIADIETQKNNFKKKKEKKVATCNNQNKYGKNKFINFKQRTDVDYEEIERLERERLERELLETTKD